MVKDYGQNSRQDMGAVFMLSGSGGRDARHPTTPPFWWHPASRSNSDYGYQFLDCLGAFVERGLLFRG